ncbi:MAG: cytochrome c [Hydrogenothermaceae bacterium]
MRKFIIAILIPLSLSFAENIKTIELPNIPDNKLKDGKGKELVEQYCSICHSLNYITMQKGLSKKVWQAEVKKMILFGAPIENQKDIDTIIEYLEKNY